MACAIEVQSSGPFSPGNTVNGKLLCFFSTTETIEGIKCYLCGQERTQFNVASHRDLHGIKTFLRREIEIMPACTLQPGSYKYPFSFDLPHRIPSSFEHAKGKVLYEITAEVSRGSGRFYRNSHPIQVSVTLNLIDMMHEITLAPVTYPLDEVLQSHCFCYNAHVFLVMSLEKDAFLVGENINIKLNVNNAADVNINDVVLKLESHTEVTAEHPQRRKFISVADVCTKRGSGMEGRSQRVYAMGLKVPGHLYLPCLTECTLIKQWYTVTAVIKFNDCYDQVRLPGYIKLGHIFIERHRLNGLAQPSEEDLRLLSKHTSKKVIPKDIYPPERRPPHLIEESHFPTPLHNDKMPPRPAVHLSTSYSITPSAPPSTSSSRRSLRNSFTLKEAEALLPQNGTEMPILPPTYYEAIHTLKKL